MIARRAVILAPARDVKKAWPNASTTGIPTGVTLTAQGSDFTSSSDRQVIQRLDVNGIIFVAHSHVTVRQCRADKLRIGADDVVVNATNCVVEDCTFIGSGSSGVTGVDVLAGGGGNANGARIRRCDISGVENGFTLSEVADVIIEDNYLHDFAFIGGDPHVDGLQCPISGPDILLEHNTIEGDGPTVNSSCTTWANSTDVTINNNRLHGGTAIIYIEGGCSGFVVSNNRMTQSQGWGLVAGVTASAQTYFGNVDDDTGAPLDLP